MSASLLLALACLSSSAAPPMRLDALGDPLPLGAVARMGTTRLRTVFPEAIAFSADGKTVISATFESGQEETVGRFQFWDVRTGRRVRTIDLPTGEETGRLQIPKDGKTLAVVDSSENGWEIRLFDARTGKSIARLRDRVRNGFLLALSPDGKTAVVNERAARRVSVWDVGSASVRFRIADVDPDRDRVAFLPDSKSFVVRWSDYKLHLIRTADGKSIRDLQPDLKEVTPSAGRVVSLGVTPDGKQVVYRLDNDRAIRVVELATGKEIRKWDDDDKPTSIDVLAAADSRTLVTSSKAGVRVWDLATGKRVREIKFEYACRFALSPDGKTVALAGFAAIRVHDVATGKPLHDVGHWTGVEELAFSADGKRLASRATDSARVWDASSGEELSRFESPGSLYLTHLRWAGDSVRWVGSDNALYYWKPGDREAAKRTDPLPRHRNFYARICPNGEWLAVESDGKVRLESLANRRRDRLLLDPPTKSDNFPASSLFSPDGRLLAIVPRERRTVIVFDVASGERMQQLPFEAEVSYRVAFAPDGRSLLLHDGKWRDSHSQVYEVATGGLRLRFPDYDRSPGVVAWTPDGRLVACGDWGGSLSVCDLHSAKVLWKGNR